jgi:hypothetical protein
MKGNWIRFVKFFFLSGSAIFSGMAGFRLILRGGVFDEHIGFYLGIALIYFFFAMNILAIDLYGRKT